MASNNSSKTAHVMNLLSKNRAASPEPPEAPKEEAAPQPESASPAEAGALQPAEAPAAPQAAPARQVAPIISSINADAAVSSQIKDALEAELEESAPVSKPPVQQTAPDRQPAPVQPAAPVQEAPAAPVQAPPAPQDPVPENPEEEKPAYINVMQLLVDEKADEYMKMFGICCCDKCRVDVRAYALNHLPPKYVVLSQNERVPRLTVYESRFASDVTAQLIQACKKVMLTPHHSRPND